MWVLCDELFGVGAPLTLVVSPRSRVTHIYVLMRYGVGVPLVYACFFPGSHVTTLVYVSFDGFDFFRVFLYHIMRYWLSLFFSYWLLYWWVFAGLILWVFYLHFWYVVVFGKSGCTHVAKYPKRVGEKRVYTCCEVSHGLGEKRVCTCAKYSEKARGKAGAYMLRSIPETICLFPRWWH